jgi:hypothetical protein
MALTSCVQKVPFIVSSYRKNTRALTFENVCQVCVNMPSDFWVKTGQVLTSLPVRGHARAPPASHAYHTCVSMSHSLTSLFVCPR